MYAGNPASTIVETVSFYRHPKTGRRVAESQEKAFRGWFKKKYKRLPGRERWLYVLDKEPMRKRGGVRVGDTYHRIQQKVKMTEIEKILPTSSFENRHIRETLTNKKVFVEVWKNWGGVIRVMVSGWQGSRRIKEVIHLAYHREHWEKQEGGREKFRRWLTAAISSNLRRRGLRLSNVHESRKRIDSLTRELRGLQGMTEFVDAKRMGGHVQQMAWKAKAIQAQKKSKSLTRATIRLEKLV